MQKWIMLILVSAASLLAVYLLLFETPDKPIDESASLPEGVELLKIEATSIDFSFDREVYEVVAGQEMRLKLVNKVGKHGITIEGLDIKLDENQMEIDYVFDKPGEYELICSIPCGTGHSTMTAKFVVLEATDAPADEGAAA